MFKNASEYLFASEAHYKKSNLTFSVDNLRKTIFVVENAFKECPRMFAFRVDLHFPINMFTMLLSDKHSEYFAEVIKAFFEELQKILTLSEREQANAGVRVRRTEIRYVWAREQTDDALVPHYHLMFFFNRDAYFRLGNFNSERLNLANKIRLAWYRAIYEEDLSIDFCKGRGLVHFPKNGEHQVNAGDSIAINKMLLHVAYLSKKETKRRGEGYRCFGGSNR